MCKKILQELSPFVFKVYKDCDKRKKRDKSFSTRTTWHMIFFQYSPPFNDPYDERIGILHYWCPDPEEKHTNKKFRQVFVK